MLIVNNPYENLLYKHWSIDDMDIMLEIRRLGEEENAGLQQLLSTATNANAYISAGTALSTAYAG